MSEAVFICSRCYNKIPQTGLLINNQNLFLTVVKAGSLRSWHWLVVAGEDHLLDCILLTTQAVFSGSRREEWLAGASFPRTLIPSMRLFPQDLPNHPQNLTSWYYHIGHWDLTYEFRGEINIYTTAKVLYRKTFF